MQPLACMDAVKNVIGSGYPGRGRFVEAWGSRSICVLLAGFEFAKNVLQNRSVAVIALIGANLILVECADRLTAPLNARFKARFQDDFSNDYILPTINLIVGISMIAIGITVTVRTMSLPLNLADVLVLSGGTLFVRSCFK